MPNDQPRLNVIEQAFLAGAEKFLAEHPEVLQQVVSLAMAWVTNALVQWLETAVATGAASAGSSPVLGMPTGTPPARA